MSRAIRAPPSGCCHSCRERLRSAGFDETLRIIREEEPTKPSVKAGSSPSLPTVAANRRDEPARLCTLIRGELDWIVLKALEKDRGRRYDSAGKFAEDVENYLNGDPVQAAAPSTAYRFRKFARRNRAAIGTAAAIVVLMVGGIAATTWQAVRATTAKNRAVAAEQLAVLRLNESETEKNRAVAAERLAERRLGESEAARKETQATVDLLNDLLKKPSRFKGVGEGKMTLVELREEIANRKVLNLDTDMLEAVDDFARSSDNFAAIEGVVKERLSEQIRSVVTGGKANRSRFSQLMYLAEKVGMKEQLLGTVRPLFAKSVEGVVLAVLTEEEVDLDDFNGVRELSESAPDLVREDLRERIRPAFSEAVEKLAGLPSAEFKTNRQMAFQLFEIGKCIQMKEVVPLALRVATAEKGWQVKTKRDAVHLVGRYGAKKHIEPLSSLLEDRAPLYTFGQLSMGRLGFISFLGDEALAAVVHLRGGDLAEYGFARPGLPNPTYPDRWFTGWGFFGPSEEAIETVRQQALKKWKAGQSKGS